MGFYETLRNDMAALVSSDFAEGFTLRLDGVSIRARGIFDEEFEFFNPETRTQMIAENPRLTLFPAPLEIDPKNTLAVFNIRGIDYRAHHWTENPDGTLTLYLQEVVS